MVWMVEIAWNGVAQEWGSNVGSGGFGAVFRMATVPAAEGRICNRRREEPIPSTSPIAKALCSFLRS